MENEMRLRLAQREVPDALDRVRRYCGLTWSGGPPEVWAWQYYDALPTSPDRIEPTDVLAAAALHPGLTRSDLAFFAEHRAELEAWLAPVPHDARLYCADDGLLDHLDELLGWADEVTLGLLTKVLHRKRPGLIPLVDRVVLDWYRPVTGERTAKAAWPKLLRSFWDDTGILGSAMLTVKVAGELGGDAPTALRFADIALWMGAQR